MGKRSKDGSRYTKINLQEYPTFRAIVYITRKDHDTVAKFNPSENVIGFYSHIESYPHDCRRHHNNSIFEVRLDANSRIIKFNYFDVFVMKDSFENWKEVANYISTNVTVAKLIFKAEFPEIARRLNNANHMIRTPMIFASPIPD